MGFKKSARERSKKVKKSGGINTANISLFHRKHSKNKDSLWKEINELSKIAKKEIPYYNTFGQSPPRLPKTYTFCDTIISKNEFGEVQGYLIYIPWENVPMLVNQIFKPPLNTFEFYVEWNLAWLKYCNSSKCLQCYESITQLMIGLMPC